MVLFIVIPQYRLNIGRDISLASLLNSTPLLLVNIFFLLHSNFSHSKNRAHIQGKTGIVPGNWGHLVTLVQEHTDGPSQEALLFFFDRIYIFK